MKSKTLLITIAMILIIPVFAIAASPLDLCEDGPKITTNCRMVTPTLLGCSVNNYSIYNTSGGLQEAGTLTELNDSIYYFNFTLGKGQYIIKLCDGAVREVIAQGEKNEMASLSVTVFVLLITIGMFIIPFFARRSINNEILKRVITGTCIILGLFFLSLDATIVATMASNADLGVTKEIFRYLWIIDWAAYLSIVFVILKYGHDILKLWGEGKERKRNGEI